MTTLYSVHNSDGEVGRCDAKCYNATGEVCTCVCGGMNHGKGLEVAKENIRDNLEVLLPSNVFGLVFEVTDEVYQMPLWEEEYETDDARIAA